jgi:hypothetical protein
MPYLFNFATRGAMVEPRYVRACQKACFYELPLMQKRNSD